MPLVVAALEGDEKAGPLLAVPLEEPERTLPGAIDEGVFGQFVSGTQSSGHGRGDCPPTVRGVVDSQDVRRSLPG